MHRSHVLFFYHLTFQECRPLVTAKGKAFTHRLKLTNTIMVTLRVIKGVNILMDYRINQLTWTNITLLLII